MQYDTLPAQDRIDRAMTALSEHGFVVHYVASGEEAREKVLQMIPEKAQVLNMTSMTLESTGIAEDILNSGRYEAVRHQLNDSSVSADEKRRLGSTPLWTVGSVHAVTESGSLLIASNTGSQLPAYAYGAAHVIWVVGLNKLVATIEDGSKRIYEYTLPLESDRAHKAYGVPGSFVSKLLIVNKEVQPGRIHIILVNEVLGF